MAPSGLYLLGSLVQLLGGMTSAILVTDLVVCATKTLVLQPLPTDLPEGQTPSQTQQMNGGNRAGRVEDMLIQFKSK
ncbi:hypothetical protein RvY_17113 [Ramazzottius varieornatus]|uniref:Uncharacterized protein n=1 Tax=Ramazzottius varieornatus TaxID=947166 RepID=A0A1D1W0Z8_RAMVA|nr:hypothetical protein RvY_17113 [Ramazzottius varieornatus]